MTKAVADCLRRQPPPYLVLDTDGGKGGGLNCSRNRRWMRCAVCLCRWPVWSRPTCPKRRLCFIQSLRKTNRTWWRRDGRSSHKGRRRCFERRSSLSAKRIAGSVCLRAARNPFFSPRVYRRKNTHGTGCSLSAALAALRPQCKDWPETIAAPKTGFHRHCRTPIACPSEKNRSGPSLSSLFVMPCCLPCPHRCGARTRPLPNRHRVTGPML